MNCGADVALMKSPVMVPLQLCSSTPRRAPAALAAFRYGHGVLQHGILLCTGARSAAAGVSSDDV